MSILASHRRIFSFVLKALLMHKPTTDNHHLQDEDKFISDDLPPIGMKVEIMGYVGSTKHVIPFVCCWTEEGWVVAGTCQKLAFDVAGWRRAGI